MTGSAVVEENHDMTNGPPEPRNERYYIVRVELENIGAFAGRRDKRYGWLSFDSGYPSHSIFSAAGAHRFEKIPTAAEIAAFDGCPWMDKHADAPPEIYQIVERRFVRKVAG